MVMASTAYAAQGPVGLGTATSFAILAGSGITNTGATTVSGDIGTFPTPSESGFGSLVLSGANHHGDAVTQGAKSDLVAAYNDAAGRTPATSVPVELGGSTLLPGVYTSPTFGLTGTVTLNAQGDPDAEFIFKAGSTLITASDSRVLLINGAQACHVVWQVGSSATFGTGTSFVGDVLSHTSITADTSATFQGRLLARNGAVTLDTNTISASTCATPPPPTDTPTPTPTSTGTGGGGGTPSPTAVPTGSSSGSPVPTSSPTGSSRPTSTPTRSTSHSPAPVASNHHTPGTTVGRGHLSPHPPSTSIIPSLPFTGSPTTSLVEAGVGLLGLGVVALIVGRRRRTGSSL
jgi:type VI secretion system secreted protein VgrG